MEQFKYTLLLVEDDISILKLLEFIFKKEYNVILAENGQIAYEKVQERKPDLIISDIMMPVLTGIEFKEKLDNDTNTSLIPFVFLSAIDDDNTKEKITKLKGDHIIKPIKPSDLRDKVKSILVD